MLNIDTLTSILTSMYIISMTVEPLQSTGLKAYFMYCFGDIPN